MHYTLVYADPPKDLWTPGTLLVAVLSQINPPINLRSSPLLSHQIPDGTQPPIKLLRLCINDSFCCAVTHPLLTDALLSSVLLYPFRIFGILLS